MINNVVFDFGQVLVHFIPSKMVGRYVSEPCDASLLEEVVFDRLYWDKLDEGTITDEEVFAGFRSRLPERLWTVAEEIFLGWMENIPDIEGMREVLEWVKTRGKRLFLLSNISKAFAERSGEFPILRYFEKKVFSAVCGYVKPSKEIFAYLCEECGIVPQETLFIDDSAKNIAGAESFGIHGYLFDGNVEKLKEYLEGVL